MKNHEFATWLKHVHKTYFTDLLAEKARALFKDFVSVGTKVSCRGASTSTA
jgi:hypothetical protein